MPSVIRHAKVWMCVACVLIVGGSQANAASVVWTINTSATTMGLSGTGQAPLSGAVAQLKVIQQGVTPFPASVTPTLPVKIGGSFVTDTDFTSSIRFLKSALVDGLVQGNYSPDETGLEGTSAPGDIGTSIIAKLGILNLGTVADGVLRNMTYDISGPQVAITGGSFPTTGFNVSIIQGRLDYRGINVGTILGSGNTNITDPLIPGDATYDHVVDIADYTVWADNFLKPGTHGIYDGDFTADNIIDIADYTVWADNFLKSEDPFPGALNTGANAKITIVGNQATLNLPLLVKLQTVIDEGETSTATDDIYVDLTFVGNIVANATVPAGATAIPEPSTLALSLAAGLGMCVVGIHRKLRRPRA